MTPAPRKPPAKAASRRQPKSQRAPPSDHGAADLDRSLTSAQVMDRNGYPYLIHPLLDGVPRASADLLAAWVGWAVQQKEVLSRATLILAPEAMGLPLAAGLSLATGIPYGVIRKRRYDLPGEEVAFAETGYGEAALHINDAWPDDRVVIVDDVLSTGGTLNGILATLRTMGVTVGGALLFVDKGTRREALEQQYAVPILAMRTITIQGGKVRIAAGRKRTKAAPAG